MSEERCWSMCYLMTESDLMASRGAVRGYAMQRIEEMLWRESGHTPQTHRIMWEERAAPFGGTILEGRLYTVATFDRLAERMRRAA